MNYKKCLLLFVALVMGATFFSQTLHAQVQSPNDEFQWMEHDEIYVETVRLCGFPGLSYESLVQSPLFKQIAINSGTQTFKGLFWDLQSLLTFLLDRGMSRAYRSIVDWPPFHLALEHCYPNNPRAQKMFIVRLFAADVIGKLGGGAGAGAVYYGTYRFFKAFARWSPVGARFVQGAAIVTGLAFLANTVRELYYGPSKEEIQEAKRQMEKVFLSGPREIDIEDLALYDEQIQEFQNELRGMPASDPRRPKIMHALERLQKRRAMIAQRVKGEAS